MENMITLDEPITFLKKHPKFEKKLNLSSDYSIVRTDELNYLHTLLILNPKLLSDIKLGLSLFNTTFSEKYMCKECGAEAMVSLDGIITRTCEHDSTVVLDISVEVFGESKIDANVKKS